MRDIERRMRELDRLDAKYGLGAALSRQRTPKDWRRWVAPLATLGLTLVLLLAVPGIAPVSLRNAFGLGPHRLGRLPPVEANGAYKFMAKQTGTGFQPVTWDPCRPIHYQVNTAGGPRDAVALVASAISEVSESDRPEVRVRRSDQCAASVDVELFRSWHPTAPRSSRGRPSGGFSSSPAESLVSGARYLNGHVMDDCITSPAVSRSIRRLSRP